MEGSILTKVVLPLSLFFVMLGMGLGLTIQDFKNTAKAPKAVGIGLGMQLLLLPLVAFFVTTVFGLKAGLAVGLIIIALCPGGVTSNMFSLLARGNVALSISLTAIVSLITPFTIPIILSYAMVQFLGEATTVALPIPKTIITLLAITVLPVGIGMLVNKKAPEFAKKCDKPVKILSIVILAVIIAGISKQNWDKLPEFFAQVGWACLLLCALTMLMGFWGSKLLGAERKDSITIGIEVGIQNGTTGIFIASTLLKDPVMSIPAAVYSLIMFVVGGVYAWIFSRNQDRTVT